MNYPAYFDLIKLFLVGNCRNTFFIFGAQSDHSREVSDGKSYQPKSLSLYYGSWPHFKTNQFRALGHFQILTILWPFSIPHLTYTTFSLSFLRVGLLVGIRYRSLKCHSTHLIKRQNYVLFVFTWNMGFFSKSLCVYLEHSLEKWKKFRTFLLLNIFVAQIFLIPKNKFQRKGRWNILLKFKHTRATKI